MTPDAHLHSVSEDLVDFGSDTVAGFKPAGLAVKDFLRLQPLSLLAAGIRITSRAVLTEQKLHTHAIPFD